MWTPVPTALTTITSQPLYTQPLFVLIWTIFPLTNFLFCDQSALKYYLGQGAGLRIDRDSKVLSQNDGFDLRQHLFLGQHLL